MKNSFRAMAAGVACCVALVAAPARAAECPPPQAGQMPASPPAGESRTGLICAVHIPIPDHPEIPGRPTGVIGIQVMEPTTLTGGETYPLILDGHGFSASRQKSPSKTGTAGLTVPTQPILDSGYGLISIDQAGHGETGGLIRIMDPDQEGRFLVAILDWAEENLDWLAYGPDEDAHLAREPRGRSGERRRDARAKPNENLLLGAIGPSYGGGYQMLLHTVDPEKRLDVIVPQITWHDLSYSVFPGTVPKALWGAALFGLGSTAGHELNRGNFDPFVQRTFLEALGRGRVTPEGLDYFRYHGMGYFCDGDPVAGNGDDGTISTPGAHYNVDYPQPQPQPTKVHALFFQGMRDVLFNFNEAWLNYRCLRRQGGDVRLLTYQSGHNTIPVAPDPYATPDNSVIGACGQFEPTRAAIAFFDRYLKNRGEIDSGLLPAGDQVCMSLHGTDAVLVPEYELPVGLRNTRPYEVPSTYLVSGVSSFTPVPLDYRFEHGNVLAGIPYLDVMIESACDMAGGTALETVAAEGCAAGVDPDSIVVFAGVAVNTGSGWQLADNQVMPLRGTGIHQVELVGIGERLSEGAEVGLALFGIHEQFVAEGGLNAGSPVVLPLTVEGQVYMPLITAGQAN